MNELLVKILPLDLASTLSPGILALTVFILAKKEYSIGRTIALGLGSLLVAVLLAILGLKLGKSIQDPTGTNVVDNIIDLSFAALFLYFGVKSLLVKDDDKSTKKLEQTHSRQLWKWLLIGFIISITNLDAVIFNFSAAKEIGQSGVNEAEKLILLVAGALFFISPILLPFVLYLVMPKLADKILNPLDKFLTKYGRYLVAVIFIVFAIYLALKGLKNI